MTVPCRCGSSRRKINGDKIVCEDCHRVTLTKPPQIPVRHPRRPKSIRNP